MTTSSCRGQFLFWLSLQTALGCSRDDETWRARLKDPDPGVRRAAVHDLASTVDPTAAMPFLTDALKDSDEKVTVAAALALLKAEPRNSDCRPVIKRALLSGQAPVFIAVGATGVDAKWAVPTLVQLLNDRKATVRALAAKALGEIGDANSAVLKALQQHAQDASPTVRTAVENSLDRLRQSLDDAS